MEKKGISDADLATQLESILDELKQLRRDVAAVEQRLSRLEVREELVEAPEAAGDEPVVR